MTETHSLLVTSLVGEENRAWEHPERHWFEDAQVLKDLANGLAKGWSASDHALGMAPDVRPHLGTSFLTLGLQRALYCTIRTWTRTSTGHGCAVHVRVLEIKRT